MKTLCSVPHEGWAASARSTEGSRRSAGLAGAPGLLGYVQETSRKLNSEVQTFTWLPHLEISPLEKQTGLLVSSFRPQQILKFMTYIKSLQFTEKVVLNKSGQELTCINYSKNPTDDCKCLCFWFNWVEKWTLVFPLAFVCLQSQSSYDTKYHGWLVKRVCNFKECYFVQNWWPSIFMKVLWLLMCMESWPNLLGWHLCSSSNKWENTFRTASVI